MPRYGAKVKTESEVWITYWKTKEQAKAQLEQVRKLYKETKREARFTIVVEN